MKSVAALFSFLLLFTVIAPPYSAQLSYGSAAAYSTCKLIPSYTGNALQVRRTCDDATKDIGFNSCGDLDTLALKAFVIAATPLSAMTETSSTAYSLRRLRCTYGGSAIRVRSSAAGSPTTDISFTTSGDLDTASLKTFIRANTGFVTIWYDQSGNARDASQSATGSQPRIVTAESIERQGNGWISECLTFNVIPSTTDRTFLEWSQSQYYSTGGPPLITLPLSAASASVTAWYDQSGNAKHISQAAAANQPALIQSGLITKQIGIPSINFNGSSTNLSASDAGLPTGNLSVTGIVKANSISPYGSILHYGVGTTNNAVFASHGTDANFETNAIGLSQYGDAVVIPSSVGPSLILTSGRSSGNYFVYRNGGSGVFKTMTTSTTLYGANGLSIGSYNPGSGGGYLNGSISEVGMFPSALSNTQRILIETNCSAYTTLTVSNSKYTPPTATSYHRFVNGVGSESSTDGVAGTRSTMGMGISIGSTGTDFLKGNGEYITYGINCPALASSSTLNLPGTAVQRWANDWYLNKTDISSNNGTINFFFDFSDYGLSLLPGAAANCDLLNRNTPSGAFSIVSGTTKSLVGDRVYFSISAASIPTNFYYTIGTQNTSTSPHPIELLSFEVLCKDYKTTILWATASQTNNDHFSIERTANGINYEAIGIIKGAGTTSERKSYSYTDDRPLNGLSYYRLTQTDINGSESTFPVVKANCESSGEGIKIYPNPNNGTFTLEGARLYSDVTIINSWGANVFEKKNVLSKEEITLTELPNGIYFVKIVDLTGQTLLKLIIQR